MMRDIKTRKGFEYWDKICALKHYGFIHSPDNSRVLKAEGIGNWIDKHEAQSIVDEAQDEVNQLRAERDALQQRLNAADQRVDELEALLLRSNELFYAIQGDPGAVPSSSIDAMRGEVFTALKPAAGSTCNQVREESGLPVNVPCQACGRGTCIDR